MKACTHHPLTKEVHRVRVEVCPTCEPARAKAMKRSRGQQLAAIIRKTNWGGGQELPPHIVEAASLLASYLEGGD